MRKSSFIANNLRFIIVLVLAGAAVGVAAWYAGRGLALRGTDGVIVVGDKRFALQMQDMGVNAHSYVGRTVRMAGFTLPLDKGAPWRFAVARIFYCCGEDGAYPVGLPCEYEAEAPAADAWIEVEATFCVDGEERPYLEITKLTVKDTPGAREVYS